MLKASYDYKNGEATVTVISLEAGEVYEYRQRGEVHESAGPCHLIHTISSWGEAWQEYPEGDNEFVRRALYYASSDDYVNYYASSADYVKQEQDDE